MNIWIVGHQTDMAGEADEIDGHFSTEAKAREALAALGDRYQFWVEEVPLDPDVKCIPRITTVRG